jgi:hypothetical protein
LLYKEIKVLESHNSEERHVIDDDKPARPSRPRATSMDEYNAKQEAERAKTVRLRELRLAAAGEPKAKRKAAPPGGKGKNKRG